MWTSSGFLILKSEMAAYGTVLLVVLTTDIAGVKSEWPCNNTCCAGAFSLGSKKCEKLRPCSDTGQYIIRAGNETQDNKCWCDEGKGFSPIRPKLCWDKSEACGCLQCPEGSKPDVIDKNGQYVEHFDKDKHCKRMCDNEMWAGIGISIGTFIGVICVLLIRRICCCLRHKKYTCAFKFMTKESHENALTEAREIHENALKQEKENAYKDVIEMGEFVLDKTLIEEFETGGFLSKEDTIKWIKDTYQNIPRKLQLGLLDANPPAEVQQNLLEAGPQAKELIDDLEASKKKDDRFPLGKNMHCIAKPKELYIIRETAIDVLKGFLKTQHKRTDLLGCLVNSGFGDLANRLRGIETRQAQDVPLDDIRWLAQCVFDWILVKKFEEKTFLTGRDINTWIMGTYTNVINYSKRVQLPHDGEDPEGGEAATNVTPEKGLILSDLERCVGHDKFPLVASREEIRKAAIKALMEVIKRNDASSSCTLEVFRTCLSEAGYGRLVQTLKDRSNDL